jgi:hypothetical protein
MAEKMPLITSVKHRLPAKVNTEGWSVVVCEVDTAMGPMLLQLTSNAAHDLRKMLEGDLPPRATPSNKVRL